MKFREWQFSIERCLGTILRHTFLSKKKKQKAMIKSITDDDFHQL